VNPRMAENLSTVLACVNAIASSCRACRRMRKLESEFSRSVFSAATRSTHRLELDLSGLLRGDPAQRWQSWAIAVQNGILSPGEVREEEGWNLGAPRKSAPASAT
jgi:phage portal protein BeeE